MKRLYCLFLCLILNICYSSTALASDYTYSSTTTEILDDGSYIETTIKTNTSINLFSSTFTKNGQKTSTYKDSSGKIYWSITCPSKLWKLSSKSSGKSGATATASVVAKRYTNGSITKTIKRSVSLTCSKTGKLS